MHLPVLKNNNRYERRIVTFGGLNLLQSFSEGEMSDCRAISHSAFPAITQREKSELVFPCSKPTSIVVADKECIATSGALYYDRKKVLDIMKGEKTLAFLGSKIMVFPDKVYYDTQTQESGTLSGEVILSGMDVKFSASSVEAPKEHFVTKTELETNKFPTDEKICAYKEVSLEKNVVTLSGFSLKKIEDMAEGDIFAENCGKNQYRVILGKEISPNKEEYIITNELVTLENETENVFASLSEGDVVEISGCTKTPSNNKTATILSKEGNILFFAEDTFVSATENESVTIKRKIPDFACVCTYNNRLWGCSGNTLYASALGDPFNFFKYQNLSTDSFTVQSNTPGDFTACVVYGNYCLFFKEEESYKLYGTRPANFQLSECFAGGIKKSDRNSLATVNGKLFYKGNGGIFAFSGGFPQCVSHKISPVIMENTVGGSDGKRYYITADTNEGREEFVFDSEKALWSRSGTEGVNRYSAFGGNMYRLKDDGVYIQMEETDTQALWQVLLCPFDEKHYRAKNYNRLHVTARLFDGAYLCVEVSSDAERWEKVATVYGNERKYVDIPCFVKNCRQVQIRLSGKGKSIIESVSREFSVN